MNNNIFKVAVALLCFATIQLPQDNISNTKTTNSSNVVLLSSQILNNSKISTETIKSEKDNRAQKLKKYLEFKNSPYANKADFFVKTADKYDIDYTLLPSISGIESSFGTFLMPNSYNPFGWGGGYIYYDSWEECIESVAKGITTYYPSDNPEEIGPIYTPPNYVKWIAAVKQFQNEIRNVEIQST